VSEAPGSESELKGNEKTLTSTSKAKFDKTKRATRQQGRHSGERSRLTQVCNVDWVRIPEVTQYVVHFLTPGFFPVYSGFPSTQRLTIPKSNSICDARIRV